MARSVLGKRGALVGVLIACMLGTTACGVILYPERRGQASGQIDPGIAIFDGIGLLFFIVPGVIAYAVDFATGTIYLPHSASNGDFDVNNATAIQTGNKHLDEAAIQRAIRRHTGEQVSMNDPALRARRTDDTHWQRLGEVLEPAQYAAITAEPLQASR